VKLEFRRLSVRRNGFFLPLPGLPCQEKTPSGPLGPLFPCPRKAPEPAGRLVDAERLLQVVVIEKSTFPIFANLLRGIDFGTTTESVAFFQASIVNREK
jgi:hypothetical protein